MNSSITMNHSLKFLGSCLLLMFLLTTATNLDAQRRCGTQHLHNQKMENDPQYKQQFNSYEKKMTKLYKKETSRAKAACTNPTFYPVAIHYDWMPSAADQAELIKLAENQVATMNAAFNGNDCTNGVNTNCYEFIIATTGHPTSSGLADGAPAITFGGTAGADYCPTVAGDCEPCDLGQWVGYLNITVNRLSAANRCTSLGIAQLASDPSLGQSMSVNSCAFGSTGIVASGTAGVLDGIGGDADCDCLEGNIDKGITTTHEIGHMLGLYHTFCSADGTQGPYAGVDHSGTIAAGESCEQPDICQTGCAPGGTNPNPWVNDSPAGSGPYECDCDRIADTPAQAYAGSGCPTTGTTVPNASEAGAPNKNFNNYMDYGDDACLTCFTPNQYAVVNATRTANPAYKTKAATVMSTITAPTVSVEQGCSCNGTSTNAFGTFYTESLEIMGTAGASVDLITNSSMKAANGSDLSGNIGTIPASRTLSYDYLRSLGSTSGVVTIEIGGVSNTVILGACPTAEQCVALIPTMGQWAIFILGLLMSSLALVFIYNRSPLMERKQ